MLEYPKPMMKTSEINPMKKNSSILYDTAGFDAWRQKQIKMQVKSMQRGR